MKDALIDETYDSIHKIKEREWKPNSILAIGNFNYENILIMIKGLIKLVKYNFSKQTE